MKKTEVMEKLANISDLKVRDIDHQPTTRIEVTPEMVVLRPGGGDKTLELDEEGAKSMAQHAGIPVNLIDRISPRTFGQVATELLARKERYSCIMQEGHVIGFDKPRGHRALAMERVLQTLERSLPVFNYQRVSVENPCNVALEVVGDTQKPVVRGDMVRAGALVSFSPVGTIFPQVQSYVLRLSCTNGATSMDYLEKYAYGGGGGGEGDDIWQWFRQAARQSFGQLDKIVKRWNKMREDRIAPSERAQLLEGLIREARLPDEAADTVRAMAIERPPRNSYEMMNLLTYASSHLLEEPRQIRRAQDFAATYADPATHSKICPVCRKTG